MGIFLKPKNQNDLMLVFDIGSSSIGGAFFINQKSGAPKIIFSIRELIPLENEINSEDF